MSTNKYRRRRAMRTPTAGTKYQNEPIQAPLQKVEKTPSFDDVGREDGEELQSQLDDLKDENASIREENKAIRDETRDLVARLERLEAIALGTTPASSVATR